MLIQFFKIISGALLLGVLFVLLTNRELIIKPKNVQAPHSYSSIDESIITPPTLEQKPVAVTAPPQATTTTKPLTPQAQASVATTSTALKQALTKIEPISKNNLYIAMEEGQSDTDRSYRPSISPCKVTMGYKIGRFDSQFGISQAKFISEVDAAAALWGNQQGKTLFVYNENGPLTINLIYDERQARTDDVNNLALDIDNAKNTADSLKNTYEQEKAIYMGDGEQLTKDTEAFKARYQIYVDQVAMYNSQGGAPREEYDRMTKELETLKQMSKDLTARRDALLVFMETINAKVAKYNELVSYINSLIAKSNSLGARKFTEGRFTPRTNTIDIYQYNDLVKLRRVIAHELGHVIGINHTESMHSIMYAVNTGTSTTLGADDISALRSICPK